LVEISTLATIPPESLAVPLIVTGVPALTFWPEAGLVIMDTGGVVSVDAWAAMSPLCNVAGCTPISAKRFTVACCIFGSGFGVAKLKGLSWLLFRPHDQSTVPLPNTNAPLGARYSVMWCVAVPAP
jgi:hypothetical protein